MLSIRLLPVLTAGLFLLAPVTAPPAVAAGGTAAARSFPSARVSLVARPARVSTGDRVSIRVRVASKAPFASAPFHLHFDPKVLKFEGATEGPFLRRGGGETAFLASTTSQGDEVVVGLSLLGRDRDVSGKGDLCTLTFTAVAPGDARLSFSQEKLKDGRDQPVPAVFATVSLAVR